MMNDKLHEPIVVGVDGSDEGIQAVRYAVREARTLDCGVRLVHAIPETVPMAPMYPLISADSLDRVGQRIVNESKRLVNDLAGDQVPVERVVSPGARVHVLDDAGQDARMIILGHRDRSILGRVLTSSTTTGVSARARCPVVCVPSSWTPGSPKGRVVVGVKSEESAQEPLAVAFAAADTRKARLTVLHAWKPETPYGDFVVSQIAIEAWVNEVTAKLDEVLRHWREAYPEVEVDIDVRAEFAGSALVAASQDAELLVLGRRGRGPLRRFHLGATARTLIRETRCPLAIAPNRLAEVVLPAQRLSAGEEISRTPESRS